VSLLLLTLVIQVHDRLGQNDVTVEHVSQELAAMYSASAVDQVFSLLAEYDGQRLVIEWHDGILLNVHVVWLHR